MSQVLSKAHQARGFLRQKLKHNTPIPEIPLVQRRSIAKRKANRMSQIQPRMALFDVDLPPNPPHLSKVNHLYLNTPSQLITSCGITDNEQPEFPAWSIPEVCFSGRSNCGKSSTLNALVGQKKLVATSKAPGRTQLLHFYSLGGKKGSLPFSSLVDMPGYGFASASRASVNKWYTLVGSYLEDRNGENLRRVFILLDSRRGLTDIDKEYIELLNNLDITYQIVLTKIDTVSPKDIDERFAELRSYLESTDNMMINPIVHLISSKHGFGIQELRTEIAIATDYIRSG